MEGHGYCGGFGHFLPLCPDLGSICGSDIAGFTASGHGVLLVCWSVLNDDLPPHAKASGRCRVPYLCSSCICSCSAMAVFELRFDMEIDDDMDDYSRWKHRCGGGVPKVVPERSINCVWREIEDEIRLRNRSAEDCHRANDA